ncbi:unnamed protein product [Diatraea saccharalis]|uniref:Cytochrome P450 n=1 Tax=Diatraea saccharalis TaxID=40085 RepID=A0A9N9REN4_9NEOP|nr:unnamed protein product [Diatraea saccharalis]
MIGIIILIAGITYFMVLFYKNAYKRMENFPPGPPSLPVYGAYWIVLLTEINNLAGAFRKLSKIYNTKIVGLNLGVYPTIVVNDSALIKKMLYTEEFDGRVDIILSRLRSYWKKLEHVHFPYFNNLRSNLRDVYDSISE